MRPVNLIPPEDRRGDHAPLRAGSLSYVLVGAIAAGLVAVLAMVLTQNGITQSEADIAELEVARDAASQRAEALAPYAEFASLQAERQTTIASLAESRFDWERVLRELALVIPGGVSLTDLEAATAGAEASESESSSAPSLVMTGCAPDHTAVATFVAALEDIDGITRVALDNSVAVAAAASGSGAGGAESVEGCGPGANSFAVRAVFDDASAASVAAEPAAPPATVPAAETNSPNEQIEESHQATNLVPGAAR